MIPATTQYGPPSHVEAEAHNAMDRVPGLDTPWPDARRWAITRRLLALWRWEHERGPDSDAACNARKSLQNRAAALGVEVL